MKNEKMSNILIKEKTKDRLKDFGKKGDTYDIVINKVVDFYQKNFKG